jgi:cobalt-zinc-cadmium efflux system outer membrane protein
MKKLNLKKVTILVCITLFATSSAVQSLDVGNQWKDPFPSSSDTSNFISDSLTLDVALQMVIRFNSSLKASQKHREAVRGLVRQANFRPNPELELEGEDVAGDLKGFSESEMTIQLSQDLELWGQRKARRNAALRNREAVNWETRMKDFDIYAETKLRFYELLHTQKKLKLSEQAAQLALEVTESARVRVKKGAALSSEHLLARLGFDRAQMGVALAETELENAQRNLNVLWRGEGDDLKVVDSDPTPAALPDINVLKSYLKGSREALMWTLEQARIKAQLNLERANGLPSPSLSGGYKRSEVEDINTFLIGFAIPIPLFNRNQGNISSLQLQSEAAKSAQEQALANAEAELQTIHRRLSQLISNHESLDTLILPKAEETYLSLKQAYELGRIPYSTLLEGEQSLIDVSFELNDLDLVIKQETIALEQLLGISLKDIITNQRRR